MTEPTSDSFKRHRTPMELYEQTLKAIESSESLDRIASDGKSAIELFIASYEAYVVAGVPIPNNVQTFYAKLRYSPPLPFDNN